MNILFANWRDITSPLAGGAERHVHNLAIKLVQRGHRVTMLVGAYPGCKKREVIDNIEIIRVGGKYSRHFMIGFYFVIKGLDKKYDAIVESVNGVPFFLPYFTRKNVTILIHQLMRDVFFLELPKTTASFAKLLEDNLHILYSKPTVITISESSRYDLRAIGFPNRLKVVSPSLDDEFLSLIAEKKQHKDPELIAYVGRIKKYKGVQHIIEALPQIRQRIPAVKLFVAGSGDYLPDLEHLANSLGLSDCITFAGKIGEREKVALLQKASVFVCPSFEEGGWTIASLEAMACGCPVVVTASQVDMVDGYRGVVVPWNSPTKIAEAVTSILTDSRDLVVQRSSACEKWAINYTYESAALALENILEHREAGTTLNQYTKEKDLLKVPAGAPTPVTQRSMK